MIAGRTHPDVARREGERYRLTLERAVVDLGLVDNVEFDDRLPPGRRHRRPAREDRPVRDALPRARADLLGSAQLRDRGRLRRRLDSVLVRAGPARDGRRRDRAVRRSGSARGGGLPLHRGAGAAGSSRGPRRGGLGDELAWPSVAEATAAVLREAVERAPRPRTAPAVDPQLVSIRTDHLQHPRRRRRDRAARERSHPQPRQRVLRRRRGPPRRRRARARPPRRRAALDVDRPPLPRVPAGCEPTRAPGCATSWGTTGAGSTSPTSATMSAGPSGRSASSSRLRGCRPSSARPPDCSPRSPAPCSPGRPSAPGPMPRSGSPASIPTASSPTPGCCSSAR